VAWICPLTGSVNLRLGSLVIPTFLMTRIDGYKPDTQRHEQGSSRRELLFNTTLKTSLMLAGLKVYQ
jgi:hypothetical protein